MKTDAKQITRDRVMAAAHHLRHGYKKDAVRNEAIGIARLELAEDLGIINRNTCKLGTTWIHAVYMLKMDPNETRLDWEKTARTAFENAIRSEI